MTGLPPRSRPSTKRARPRFGIVAAVLLLLWSLTPVVVAGQITLYDGGLGTAPSQQGWFFRYLPPVPPMTEQVGGGATTIDTTASPLLMAGIFTTDPLDPGQVHPGMPTLDRALGYTVGFDVRIDSEDHGARVDRAGFSVTVLGNDLRGIELGFWTDQVWAQSDNPLFTHAEGAAFDTRTMTHYDLSVLGSSYTLFANGSQILTGSLRDYSAWGAPYTTANQLILSDNTTSASARFDIARVTLNAAVPEPPASLLLVIGSLASAGLCRLARRRSADS